MYKTTPSEFEIQSLAFGILRKNLYPAYHVRGEYKLEKMRADIAIFKTHPLPSEPELVLIVEVKKNPNGDTTSQAERYMELTGVPCVYIRGYDDAYKAVQLVAPYL